MSWEKKVKGLCMEELKWDGKILLWIRGVNTPSGMERGAGSVALPGQFSICLLGQVQDRAPFKVPSPDSWLSQAFIGLRPSKLSGVMSSAQSDGLSHVPRRGSALCFLTRLPLSTSTSPMTASSSSCRSGTRPGLQHPGEMVLSLLRVKSPLWQFPVVCEHVCLPVS